MYDIYGILLKGVHKWKNIFENFEYEHQQKVLHNMKLFSNYKYKWKRKKGVNDNKTIKTIKVKRQQTKNKNKSHDT